MFISVDTATIRLVLGLSCAVCLIMFFSPLSLYSRRRGPIDLKHCLLTFVKGDKSERRQDDLSEVAESHRG